MKLKLIRHLWGVNEPWESCFPRFVQQGYEGIETDLPAGPADEERLLALLERHGLALIVQVLVPVDRADPSVARHVDAFGALLDRAGRRRPLLVACHATADSWSLEQALAFYTQALALERQAGVSVAHEAHRGRFFFSPWNTRDVLERLPALRLCVDYSHWVCVCERRIDDLADILRLCAARAIHLHARVGFSQGPQVPDPAAESARADLEAHEAWWDMVWDDQARRGLAVSTLTPEFGPPPYLHVDPHTGAPLADLEAVCNWMAHRQARRFARRGESA
ncbi:MAG: TIM barrel protein [Planctomycetota bacterium]|nr:TIM barrel protein [Planctomycetota bacterium]